MRRRELGRDPGLDARMVAALVLVAALYAGLFAVLYGCYLVWPAGWLYWIVVAAMLAASLVLRYRGAERLLLGSVGAVIVAAGDKPELQRRVERLAQLADLPTPRVAIVETDIPNAFAVGFTQARSVLAVTRGLLRELTGAELDAVLAHELAHVANRDGFVLTAVSVPRTTGALLVNAERGMFVWLLIWPLGLPLYALGSLISLTVSRYREFSADRGSAVLTGAPEQLMSALQKLSAATAIPEADLRSSLSGVEALCVVAVARRRFAFLDDHPPLEQRLAALSSMARELGKVP